MRKFLFLIFIPLTLFAQETDDAVFKLQNDPPPFFPFSLSGSYLTVSEADFRSSALKDKDLLFRQWEAAGAYIHSFTPVCGLLFGAGWVGCEVKMKDNPDFNETIFNYVNFLAGAYTEAFPDWMWKLTLAAYLDTEEFSFADFALYQGVLWGKYDLCRTIELDFGLIVESGLRKTKVWPIIGLIYVPCDSLAINIVFPIDVSINYFITSYLSASGSLRFLRSRHRVKETEPNPQGIFEYRTTGAEFDLTYTPFCRFALSGFVGSTTNGDLKITNHNDDRATHYKFKGSFYTGASALLSF